MSSEMKKTGLCVSGVQASCAGNLLGVLEV